MDSKLIDLFREKVNNNGADLILHRYRNNNCKNQWSIICSAMDLISVVVGEIDVRKLSKKRIADLSACNSSQEAYVVLKAGFFAKNSDLCRQT